MSGKDARCAGCEQTLKRKQFTKTQLRRPQPLCKACVQAGKGPTTTAAASPAAGGSASARPIVIGRRTGCPLVAAARARPATTAAYCAPDHVTAWLEDGRLALCRVAQQQGGGASSRVGGGRKGGVSKSAMVEASRRSKELSTSSDKVGVNFAGAAFQSLYFDSKFVRRGSLMYGLFHYVFGPPELGGSGEDAATLRRVFERALSARGRGDAAAAAAAAVAREAEEAEKAEEAGAEEAMKAGEGGEGGGAVTNSGSGTAGSGVPGGTTGDDSATESKENTCTLPGRPVVGVAGENTRTDAVPPALPSPLRVVSFGGGPGTDAAGMAWVARDFLGFGERKKQGRPRNGGHEGSGGVQCVLLDYERSWRKYLGTLQTLFGGLGMGSVEFERCDVTAPLIANRANRACLSVLRRAEDGGGVGEGSERERERGVGEQRRGHGQGVCVEEVEQGEGGGAGRGRSIVSGAGGVLKSAAALDTVRVDGECFEEGGGISTDDRADSTNSTPRTVPTTAAVELRMDLAIFAYVAHETSKAAKEGGMAFYAELARTSADGTIFIFMDVRSHSTDVLRLVADTMEEALAGTSGGGGGGGVDCGVDGTGTEGQEMGGGKDGALNSRPRKLRRLRVPPEWMTNLRSEISILQILPNVE